MTTKITSVLYLLLLLCTILISSCGDSPADSIPTHKKTGKKQDKKGEVLTSAFGEGINIGSIQYIMYPLTRSKSDKTVREGLKSYSSSGNESYWNIAFYDYKTENTHLLDTGQAMRIISFEQMNNLMIYKITYTDYNSDGQLDHKDPTYLFSSDLAGHNFKQITPEGRHIQNLQLVPKSTVILIQTINDTNNDKEFGDNDEVIPMIYDPEKADKAKDTFTSSFKIKINKEFKKLY